MVQGSRVRPRPCGDGSHPLLFPDLSGWVGVIALSMQKKWKAKKKQTKSNRKGRESKEQTFKSHEKAWPWPHAKLNPISLTPFFPCFPYFFFYDLGCFLESTILILMLAATVLRPGLRLHRFSMAFSMCLFVTTFGCFLKSTMTIHMLAANVLRPRSVLRLSSACGLRPHAKLNPTTSLTLFLVKQAPNSLKQIVKNTKKQKLIFNNHTIQTTQQTNLKSNNKLPN